MLLDSFFFYEVEVELSEIASSEVHIISSMCSR